VRARNSAATSSTVGGVKTYTLMRTGPFEGTADG
jgi:hypothetical protein